MKDDYIMRWRCKKPPLLVSSAEVINLHRFLDQNYLCEFFTFKSKISNSGQIPNNSSQFLHTIRKSNHGGFYVLYSTDYTYVKL